MLLVFDLPGPAGVHGLRDGVWEDWLGAAFPSTGNSAVAKQRVGVAIERLLQRLAEQFGAESAGVNIKVSGEALAGVQRERGDAFVTALHVVHRGLGYLDSVFHGDALEVFHHPRILDVVGEIAANVGQPVLKSREDFAARHERRVDVAVLKVVPHEVAVRLSHTLELRSHLRSERVVEMRTRSPFKPHAEFPSGARLAVEARLFQAEKTVQVIRQIRRASLTDADDPDLATAHDTDAELREFYLERECGEEAGCASAKDNDVADHATKITAPRRLGNFGMPSSAKIRDCVRRSPSHGRKASLR